MPRKPEPHELKAAKILFRESFACKANVYPWRHASKERKMELVLKVRRILRAAGRGGRDLGGGFVAMSDFYCEDSTIAVWEDYAELRNLIKGSADGRIRRVLILDCGPARRGGK